MPCAPSQVTFTPIKHEVGGVHEQQVHPHSHHHHNLSSQHQPSSQQHQQRGSLGNYYAVSEPSLCTSVSTNSTVTHISHLPTNQDLTPRNKPREQAKVAPYIPKAEMSSHTHHLSAVDRIKSIRSPRPELKLPMLDVSFNKYIDFSVIY